MTAPLTDRAQALLDLQRFHEAEETIRRQLSAEPQDAGALRLLALALHGQGRDDEALDACQAAAGLAPDDVLSLLLLADLQRQLGSKDLAIEATQRAVSAAPHNWMTFYTRAHVLLTQPDPEPAGALSDSLRAVELAPDESQAHTMLGMSYAALQQPDRARAAYETALSIDPTNVWALNNLAVLGITKGRLSSASQHLRSGLAIDPRQRLLHRNYDLLLLRLLNRLWLMGSALGILELVLLGQSASATVRAVVGVTGLAGMAAFTFHARRQLPGAGRGVLDGFWTRMAGPAQNLMVLWAVCGVCTLLTCFAPHDIARPAGIVLIVLAAGLTLSSMIRMAIRRSRADRR